MGYTKTLETKIIRVKHKVSLYVGMRAKDLMDSLKHVPPEAQVDEVLDTVGEDSSQASIEFHEERPENAL